MTTTKTTLPTLRFQKLRRNRLLPASGDVSQSDDASVLDQFNTAHVIPPLSQQDSQAALESFTQGSPMDLGIPQYSNEIHISPLSPNALIPATSIPAVNSSAPVRVPSCQLFTSTTRASHNHCAVSDNAHGQLGNSNFFTQDSCAQGYGLHASGGFSTKFPTCDQRHSRRCKCFHCCYLNGFDNVRNSARQHSRHKLISNTICWRSLDCIPDNAETCIECY